jgi:hypothetical protein
MIFNPYIIKPLYKGREDTLRVLEMQKKVGDFEYPVNYIVNDGDINWQDIVDKHRGDTLTFNKINNISRAWNIGLEHALDGKCSHLVILSNDVVLPNKFLSMLAECMEKDNLDMASPSEIYPDDASKVITSWVESMSFEEYSKYCLQDISSFTYFKKLTLSCLLIRLQKNYKLFDESFKIYYSDLQFLIDNYYEDYQKHGGVAPIASCKELMYMHVRKASSTISTSARSIESLVDDLVSDAETYYNKHKHNWKEICAFTKTHLGLSIDSNLTPNGYFNKEHLRMFEIDYRIMDSL